jgi:2-polyprenyl-3-methyl-5-hydroxy-6-metoxy-1,4-benzoquinol methylase
MNSSAPRRNRFRSVHRRQEVEDGMSQHVKKHPLQPDWRSGSHSRRFEAISPHLTGLEVLDIGAASGHKRQDWMHGQIAKVASRVVGIDIDAKGVDAVRARGYDVRLVDARQVELGERFDVVFAGELIEHLTNFEAFLDAARRHLKPGGKLVLTTPNAFCASNFVYRFGFSVRVHEEHTCWFCEDTLSTLVKRCGFRVIATDYLRHETPGSVRRALANLVRSGLPKKLAWRTLLLVAEPSVEA